jgi:hypothetical protein
MGKFNDIELENWREIDVNTDSLWLIGERAKSGKHKNVYHGNFIPQIPYQLLSRYTKRGEVVLEPFMGSGTTLFECENLGRRYIGLDINQEMIDYVGAQVDLFTNEHEYFIAKCDSADPNLAPRCVEAGLEKLHSKSVQFVLMHPPYMDIVKFTDDPNDLSRLGDLNQFLSRFLDVSRIVLSFLDRDRYFGVVIGDVYKNSEVVPLGFYVLEMLKQNFKIKLKGIIVKNIEGNRGKIGQNGIWKIRALRSDYFIFKHEYILVFKKES